MTLLGESFLAEVALIGPVVGVNAQVLLQTATSLKPLLMNDKQSRLERGKGKD